MSGPIVSSKWYPVIGFPDSQVKHTGEFRKAKDSEYILVPYAVTGEWIGRLTYFGDMRDDKDYPIAKLDTRYLNTLQIKVRVKSKYTPEEAGVMEELEAMVQRWIEKYEMENGK